MKNPLEMLFGGGNGQDEQETNSTDDLNKQEKRKVVKEKLALGELENEIVTVEVEEQQPSMFDMLQGSGMEQMGIEYARCFRKFNA